MRQIITLRARIFLLLVSLILCTLGGGVVTTWFTDFMSGMFTRVIENDVASLEAASELETALVLQRGFVTYYSVDKKPEWLTQLAVYQERFARWMTKARNSGNSPGAREVLDEIDRRYQRYRAVKQQTLELYESDKLAEAAVLHQQVRELFSEIFDLCERYKLFHQDNIVQVKEELRHKAELITYTALVVMPLATLLGFLLAWILFKQILKPLHDLSVRAGTSDGGPQAVNEVMVLSARFQSLLDDVDQTQLRLAESQRHLVQTEKLALVGKLAAGVAHSIRNPLTSVKMRLFSMQRAMSPTGLLKEDFDVISEEIRHIDSILRNFLEFSRPPKLKPQKVSPSDIVDSALELLRHRFESYGANVQVLRKSPLPETSLDPEQLKEVLVNLLVNACEAKPSGCVIHIREEVVASPDGQSAVLRLTDNGPGIPAEVMASIMQPFFTTKEEGTGLGLSIAVRIVEDHGGHIEVESAEGRGATFSIFLPIRSATRRLTSAQVSLS